MKANFQEWWLTGVMAAVIVVTLATGIISLRRDGPASEPISSALADQERFLDVLTLDLRRAVVPPVMDADEQGIRIVVPGREGDAAPTQAVAYRYFNGTVTRNDPTQPLMVRGADGGKPVHTGPVTVSASVDHFPAVLADGPGRWRVTFHSPVRPLAMTNRTRVIALGRQGAWRMDSPSGL